MNITTAVAASVETMSDAEGMAMLTGVFVFLIIMFSLIFWCLRGLKKANNPELNQALLRRTRNITKFHTDQFRDGYHEGRWGR